MNSHEKVMNFHILNIVAILRICQLKVARPSNFSELYPFVLDISIVVLYQTVLTEEMHNFQLDYKTNITIDNEQEWSIEC